MTRTPLDVGVVVGSSRSSWSRLSCILRSSQSASERNHCSACARGNWAPTTGSVLTNPVSVLFRSLGPQQTLHLPSRIHRADCSSQTQYQSVSHTLPMVLVLVLFRFVLSSSLPPLPSFYHAVSLVNKVPILGSRGSAMSNLWTPDWG